MTERCPYCGHYRALEAKPHRDEDGRLFLGEWSEVCRSCPEVQLVGAEVQMSYTMQEGSVYRLARSLRHDDVFAFPPGVFTPEVVEVDAETAAQMVYAGALVYIDQQSVAVFEHPDDKNFILGMPIDPEAVEQMEALVEETSPAVTENPPEELAQAVEEVLPGLEAEVTASPAYPTPEDMAAWGYEEDQVCEACGYYIKDHTLTADEAGEPALTCPAEQ